MDEQTGLMLMLKARSGDPEAQRQLLLPHLRALRLCAAAYLPSLADVDRVVRAVAGEAARTFADAADGEAFASWLRGMTRTKIAEQLARLAGDGERQSDPLARVLITSAREWLTTRVSDIDPEEALRRRLQLTPKSARDLLTQRFGQGQSLDRLAEHRGLGVDDLATALQTACRQLDWSADVFCGAALDSAHYRQLDGLLGGDPDCDPTELRQDMLGDSELALKVERAARAHLIATAWHAPELALDARDLATGTRRITNTRRFPSPSAGSSAGASANTTASTPATRPASPPARRTAPSRRNLSAPAPDSHQRPEWKNRGSRTATLVSLIVAGLLVSAGTIALILRSQSAPPPRPLPAPVAETTLVTTPTPPAVNATNPATSVTPAATVTKDGDRNALFAAGPGALPAPLVAYSVRRLVGGYSGPLVRVRRSNDNAERDIAATNSGTLDSSALLLFAGRNDATVSCWYDQSGNKHHMVQTKPEAQPRLVSKGTIEIENGRPVVVFDRSRFQHLTCPAPITPGTLFALVKCAAPANGAQGIMGSAFADSSEVDAFYSVVAREHTGTGEWWLGVKGGFDVAKFPVPSGRLLLWQSMSDGATPPRLSVSLDGATVATIAVTHPLIPAVGPSSLGCQYWKHAVVDPLGGALGDVIMLAPGISSEAQAAITGNLKAWWHLP